MPGDVDLRNASALGLAQVVGSHALSEGPGQTGHRALGLLDVAAFAVVVRVVLPAVGVNDDRDPALRSGAAASDSLVRVLELLTRAKGAELVEIDDRQASPTSPTSPGSATSVRYWYRSGWRS